MSMPDLLMPMLRSVALILGLLLFPGCKWQQSGPQEVKIESEPSGATLILNGKQVGKTPYTLKDPAYGKYLVQLSKGNYESADRILVINDQSSPETVIKLEQVKGLVLIETTPVGAEVTVNGVFKGKTPLLSTELPSGSHKIGFMLQGYDPRELQLEILDRAPKLVQMNMKSNYATVKIESTPVGAAVIIDGLHKGQTPCSVDDVLIGNHTVKVIKEGFTEYQEEIKISATGVFPMRVKLDEKLAALDVTSQPADARVTVNDEYKGRTPLQVTGLRDGKYRVAVEKPSFEKVIQTIEIKKTQDAKLDVNLEKSTGVLILNITPQGVSVEVDSEIRGLSTEAPFTIDLPPGSYSIKLSKAGYRASAFKMEIATRKTTSKDILLPKVFLKDTMLLLKNGRVREGMIVSTHPNGDVRLETAPGIFEEYTAGEIQSTTPIK